MTNFKPLRPVIRAGFTLTELMIAMVISMLVMVALVALLADVNRNNNELARINSQIENGRFAVQLLQTELSQAGFWGAYSPQFEDRLATVAPADVPTEPPPDPCLAYASWTAQHRTNLIGIPVQVDTAAPGTCGSGSPALIPTGQLQSGTEVLVLRRAESCVPGEANCDAYTANRLYFQASLCPTELAAGNRYVLTDVEANRNLQDGSCAAPAQLRKFVSQIYWVRNFAVTAGDGIPTLMRSEFDLDGTALVHRASTALIEGIEGFNVALGVDNTVTRCNLNTPVNYAAVPNLVDPATCTASTTTTDNTLPTNRGDGTPDGAFIRCPSGGCTAAQLTNTVAVRIHVLARSRDVSPGHTDTKTYDMGLPAALGPFNDGFKRHVFTTTARLVNVSGRRETP